MSKKERLEDLGRIAATLENILEWDFFQDETAPKWLLDSWEEKTGEQKDDVLRTLFYGRQELRWKLGELLYLANGEEV